jgi:transposase
MDRGFFSQTNLEELLSEELSFIIPATMALKEVKELMSTVQKSIEGPNNLKKFNKNPIFVKPVVLALKNSRIRGYCYYDQKREQAEKEVFYTGLYDVIEKLRGMRIPKWRNPEGVFGEQAKSLSKYLTWKQIDDHFEIGVRKNAVAQRINKMGKCFIFYNGDLDWMDCLSIYRERDAIEKAFRSLKHDIEAIPLNTNKESTTRGFIFVCFIALIIRMRLLNLMKEKELSKEYTVERLLLELEKIKQIELTNGNALLTELTKRHKKILDDLKLCA